MMPNKNNADPVEFNDNHSIMNNKNNVANIMSYHHHQNINERICGGKHQNEVAKSVILSYDKRSLDYKNNKNLIQNQKENKVDFNGNSTMVNHQIFEKSLNGINQIISGLQSKRFINNINSVESIDNLKSAKFQCGKKQKDDEILLINGIGHVAKSEALTDKVPSTISIHKINGYLNGFKSDADVKNGQAERETLPTLAKCHEKPQNGKNLLAKTCVQFITNGRSNDSSTIKINYVSRQTRGPSSGHVSNNGQAFNGNHFHDAVPTKAATNIPNIVINGSAPDTNDRVISGAEKTDERFMGKRSFSRFFFCLF